MASVLALLRALAPRRQFWVPAWKRGKRNAIDRRVHILLLLLLDKPFFCIEEAHLISKKKLSWVESVCTSRSGWNCDNKKIENNGVLSLYSNCLDSEHSKKKRRKVPDELLIKWEKHSNLFVSPLALSVSSVCTIIQFRWVASRFWS